MGQISNFYQQYHRNMCCLDLDSLSSPTFFCLLFLVFRHMLPESTRRFGCTQEALYATLLFCLTSNNCCFFFFSIEFFMDGLGQLMVASCGHVSIGHQPRGANAQYGRFRHPGKDDVQFKLQLHYYKNHLQCIHYG